MVSIEVNAYVPPSPMDDVTVVELTEYERTNLLRLVELATHQGFQVDGTSEHTGDWNHQVLRKLGPRGPYRPNKPWMELP